MTHSWRPAPGMSHSQHRRRPCSGRRPTSAGPQRLGRGLEGRGLKPGTRSLLVSSNDLGGPMARAIRFDEYGDVEVLRVEDVPRPAPGPGQVLVEVRAAGINPGEAAIRRGFLHDRFPATFPSGQGSDFAGVVAELGEGVEEIAVGDEVIGFVHTRSSHADYVVAEASDLTPKPDDVSRKDAGALFVAGTTAYAATAAVCPREGDTVVVSGAAGGVGSLAVQLAQPVVVRFPGQADHGGAGQLRELDVIPVAYGE